MFCSGLDVPRPNLLLGVMVVNKPKTEKKPNVGPDAIVTTNSVVTNIGAAAEAKTLTPAPTTASSDGKKEKSGESDCFKLAEMT